MSDKSGERAGKCFDDSICYIHHILLCSLYIVVLTLTLWFWWVVTIDYLVCAIIIFILWAYQLSTDYTHGHGQSVLVVLSYIFARTKALLLIIHQQAGQDQTLSSYICLMKMVHVKACIEGHASRTIIIKILDKSWPFIFNIHTAS